MHSQCGREASRENEKVNGEDRPIVSSQEKLSPLIKLNETTDSLAEYRACKYATTVIAAQFRGRLFIGGIRLAAFTCTKF